ncbi:MAG: hypothetical protein V4614_13715 [Pseudomonadota bacterium]
MKTSLISKRTGLMAATVALAAFGFAGAAQARDNVTFSVGIGVPGVHVGVSNAYPAYPVYTQPPVYVQPAPVYVQPRPVYYGPRPVYVAPAPVYIARPRHHRKHGGYYVQAPRPGYYAPAGYAPGYAPGYYRR